MRYVITASYRDRAKIHRYEEQWHFRDLPGYELLAEFGPNLGEHNFAVTATWDGRVTARVLGRRAAN